MTHHTYCMAYGVACLERNLQQQPCTEYMDSREEVPATHAWGACVCMYVDPCVAEAAGSRPHCALNLNLHAPLPRVQRLPERNVTCVPNPLKHTCQINSLPVGLPRATHSPAHLPPCSA